MLRRGSSEVITMVCEECGPHVEDRSNRAFHPSFGTHGRELLETLDEDPGLL